MHFARYSDGASKTTKHSHRNRGSIHERNQITVKNAWLSDVIGVCLIALMLNILVVQATLAADILVPDDYDMIVDAMDAAEFGDTVYVKAGTYKERIEIKEGVNLISFAGADGNELVDGPGDKKVLRRTVRTIIDGSDIEAPGYLISFPKDTTAPMRLDGFTFINMPKYVSGINLFVMEVRGCSPEVLNNIIAKNRSWGGILSTGLGLGMGPPLETVARPIIRNNVIYDNYGPGIANGPNSGALISDNEIFDNQFPKATEKDPDAPGIGVREYARPVIENNVCYRNGAGIGGINLDSHDDPLIIRNNLLYHNRRAGIGLRAIGGAKTNIRAVIENNKIYGNLAAGMRLSKMDQVNVSYNTVFENRRAGIAFFNVDQATIEDNEIYGNLTAGIRLLNVPAATLRRNHIYDNVTAGIDFIGWQR
jgi:parallel beta-helix repeat protein